jgi:hypothetical protein
VTVQPHVPSARLTHAGPAVDPSAQILVGASGRGPEQLSGAHEACGGGHVVTVQPHVPSGWLTHVGPAVVPSVHSLVGAAGRGPGHVVHTVGAAPQLDVRLQLSWSPVLAAGVSSPPHDAANVISPISRKECKAGLIVTLLG